MTDWTAEALASSKHDRAIREAALREAAGAVYDLSGCRQTPEGDLIILRAGEAILSLLIDKEKPRA